MSLSTSFLFHTGFLFSFLCTLFIRRFRTMCIDFWLKEHPSHTDQEIQVPVVVTNPALVQGHLVVMISLCTVTHLTRGMKQAGGQMTVLKASLISGE